MATSTSGAFVCATLAEPATIDSFIFRCFCDGILEADAARASLHAQQLGLEAYPLALRDVLESYRVFAQLEQALLADPSALIDGSWPLFTFPSEQLTACVQAYYLPNLHVVRSLLGKQLTSKLRQALDDVAETAGCKSIKECYRTFDCLKATFNCIEEPDHPPPLYPTLRTRFRLGADLAWLYSCLLFLLSHRFNVYESRGRNRAGAIPTEALVDCASAMLLHWTDPAHHHHHAPPHHAHHTHHAHGSPKHNNKPLFVLPASAPGRHLSAVIGAAGPRQSPLLLRASPAFSEPLPSIAERAPHAHNNNDADDSSGPFRNEDDGEDDGYDEAGGVAESAPAGGVQHHVSIAGFPVGPRPSSGRPPISSSASQHSLVIAGTVGWEPSHGTSTALDPVLIASLRDTCSRMLRTKVDRTTLVSAVIASFVGAVAGEDVLAAAGTGEAISSESGAGAFDTASATIDDAASVASGAVVARQANNSQLAQRAAVTARRLEPRLPAFLTSLRDIAQGLGSASEVRDLFEDVLTKLAVPLAEVPLTAAEIAALFSALMSHDVIKLLSAPAQGAAAAHAALQWRRFVAVTAFIVEQVVAN